MKKTKNKFYLLIFSALCLLVACGINKKNPPRVWELARLSAIVYEPKSNDVLPCNLVCEDYTNESMGFTAATYTNKDFKIIVYRGTKNIFDGVADIGLTLSSIFGSEKTESDILNAATDITSALLVRKVNQAMNYYKKAKQNETRKIIITGHSLGGFFAQIVGYESGETTHTFNAPGAAQYIEKMKIAPAKKTDIINHLSFDLVSSFGKHVGRDTTYNNTGHSIDDFYEYLKKAGE